MYHEKTCDFLLCRLYDRAYGTIPVQFCTGRRGKHDAEDISMLDKLINERAAEGWELATYDYMATSSQIRGAFVVTFRKEKA